MLVNLKFWVYPIQVQTRMTTTINSEAQKSWMGIQTKKNLKGICFYFKRIDLFEKKITTFLTYFLYHILWLNWQTKNQPSILNRSCENHITQIHYGLTDVRTDKLNYRVASLVKRELAANPLICCRGMVIGWNIYLTLRHNYWFHLRLSSK